MSKRNQGNTERGFTILELAATIVIIGVLAGVAAISYGGWYKKIVSDAIKNDLNGAVVSMDSYRNSFDVYPEFIPSTFTATNGVVLTGGSSNGEIYCLDGTSTDDPSLKFYIDNSSGDAVIAEGDCASR